MRNTQHKIKSGAILHRNPDVTPTFPLHNMYPPEQQSIMLTHKTANISKKLEGQQCQEQHACGFLDFPLYILEENSQELLTVSQFQKATPLSH